MRGKRLPKSYFEKFSEKPVKVVPYDPMTKIVANKIVDYLKELLEPLKPEVLHRGSTAWEIAGKGDIEIGIYPRKGEWMKVLNDLSKRYGEAGNRERDYARFNNVVEGFEVEIIMMKGKDAEMDMRLGEFVINSPLLLKQYEELKYKYAFSKREYQYQKYRFLSRAVNLIPKT